MAAGQLGYLSLLFLFALCHGGLSLSPVPAKDIDLEKTVYTAQIDRIFDAFLPLLRVIIIETGMDPLKLMDFSERVLPLPGKLKGNIDFTEGWMQELANMKRAKHIIVTYANKENKRLVLNMNLGWSVLDFNYKYSFKYLLLKRVGDVYGRFKDAESQVVVTVDLENYQLHLDSIKFTSVRKFDLRFEGHKIDPILNVVTKVINLIFRQRVLDMVESRGLMIFRKVFDDINKQIPRPDRIREKCLGSTECEAVFLFEKALEALSQNVIN